VGTTGQRCLYSAQDAAEKLELAAGLLGSIDHHRATKVANYLDNRTPGLTLATDALHQKLLALGETWSPTDLSLACRIARLVEDARKPHRPGRKRGYPRHLIGAYHLLRQRLGQEDSNALLDTVQTLLTQRHHASSAIEGFNAALRPYPNNFGAVPAKFAHLRPCCPKKRYKTMVGFSGSSSSARKCTLSIDAGRKSGTQCADVRPPHHHQELPNCPRVNSG